MSITIGKRIAQLYADNDGFSPADRQTVQKEFKLSQAQANLIEKSVQDGAIDHKEQDDLERLFQKDVFKEQFASHLNYRAGWHKWFSKKAIDSSRLKEWEKFFCKRSLQLISCNTSTLKVSDGSVTRTVLSEATTIQGIRYPKGVEVSFDEWGQLVQVAVRQNAWIDRNHYTDDKVLYFAYLYEARHAVPDPQVAIRVTGSSKVGVIASLKSLVGNDNTLTRAGELEEGTSFVGIEKIDLYPVNAEFPCLLFDGVFFRGQIEISLSEKDKTKYFTIPLTQASPIEGYPFQRGDKVVFSLSDKKLLKVVLAQDSTINGIAYKAGAEFIVDKSSRLKPPRP